MNKLSSSQIPMTEIVNNKYSYMNNKYNYNYNCMYLSLINEYLF